MGNTRATGVAFADPDFDSVLIRPNTVAQLPAVSLANIGMRDTVTDSNATLTAGIGTTVAAGGANVVPVFCDGTNWVIG